MDAGTFFVTLLTCKKFRVLAIDSRHNILHHLNTLPGNNFGLENLSTIDLLLVLRRRAAQNLRAAEALADVRSYIPSQPQDCVSNQSNGQRVIFSRNSEASRRCSSQTKIYSIGNAVFSMSSFPLLALVDENEVVNIYNLAAHRITLVSQLWHVSLDNVEKSDLVVLKMAFSHNQDLAVLYKKRRYLPDPEDQKLFPLKERRQPPPVLKLVVFKSMKGARETILHSRFFQETRNFPFLRGEPVGLAIAPDRRVCVAWKSSYESSRTTLWVVGRDAQLMQVHHYGKFVSPFTLGFSGFLDVPSLGIWL